jgi:predicted porin
MAASYLKANYVQTNGMDDDDRIWTVGADYTAGKLNIAAMYLKGDDDALANEYKDGDDDGYVFGLSYGGAEEDKPGSWGLVANYYDQAAPTAISHTMDGAWDAFAGYGFKGYKVGANLTLARKLVAEVDYYDLKGKGGDQRD